MPRLDEYQKDEWRDICKEVAKSFGKSFNAEQFEKDWAEFIDMKRKKALN